VLAATVRGAAAWPLVAAVVGWQLQASPKATDFSMAVGAALVALAIQLYFLRALRLACMPHGLAAAIFAGRRRTCGCCGRSWIA
jgi:potassium efflux system protein